VQPYFVHEAAGEGEAPLLTGCLALEHAEIVNHALVLRLRASAPCAPDLAVRLGANEHPWHVDLLFDGALSPAQLRAGDVLRSSHTLSPELEAEMRAKGVWVGVLRSSGARPDPSDPFAILAPARAPAP
jgi:hypothetical protein